MKNINNIDNNRYGILTAIKFSHYKHYQCGQKHSVWFFKCDCGNEVFVDVGSVKSGNTKSCGCLASSLVAKARTKHGYANHRKTGRFNSTYLAWRNMKGRCLNVKNDRYKNYGGRGVSVCERWLDFQNFLADMGEKPEGMSLERIDVNGNYCKENCKWISLKDQSKNKSSTIKVEFNGEVMCLSDAAKESGIEYGCLYARVKKGDTGSYLFRPSGSSA